MRRPLLVAAKVLGAVLLLALLVAGGLYLYGRRYPTHSLYADAAALPGDPLADPHGTALARVLHGAVNPSGKLPFSVAADPAAYPPFTPYAEAIDYGYYHGYTLLERDGAAVAYPFGHGLSYTDFAYDRLAVDAAGLAAGDSLRVSVAVSNVGARDGAEVVQLYVGFADSALDRPRKLLRDFAKVRLAAGETRAVELAVAREDLAYYDEAARAWAVEPMRYGVYVGGSSRDGDLLAGGFAIAGP